MFHKFPSSVSTFSWHRNESFSLYWFLIHLRLYMPPYREDFIAIRFDSLLIYIYYYLNLLSTYFDTSSEGWEDHMFAAQSFFFHIFLEFIDYKYILKNKSLFVTTSVTTRPVAFWICLKLLIKFELTINSEISISINLPMNHIFTLCSER